MPSWIEDLPIDRKLVFIMMLTVLASLIIACLTFVATDSLSTWRSSKEELQTLAGLLASHSVSALTFEDAEVAGETLATLVTKANVIGGCLYTREGQVLARYARPGAAPDCRTDGVRLREPHWHRGELVTLHPVVFHDEPLGSVYLRSDLSHLTARVGPYLLGTILAVGVSSLLALALSSRLKHLVTAPLLQLAAAVQEVSRSRDYSTRVPGSTHDEIGLLMKGFNQMLEQIQLRDEELRKAQIDLEARVQERTQQLKMEILIRDRAERNAMQRAEELARSNEELERYAYVASHDLSEPLRAVAGFAQLLSRRYQGQLDERADGYIANMVQGTARMKALLNGLLTYSRVGTRGEAFAPIRLQAVFRDAMANLAALVEETGARVGCDPLPEIEADATQMLQLFQNLIANAIKFRAEETPEVHVGARRLDDAWEISVRDNGIGIEERYQERIFAIFQRLHTRRVYEGTGIGLAVCKRIVERHGGRIRVESVPNEGSTFSFTLPDEREPA